jgi:hypothetical protein
MSKERPPRIFLIFQKVAPGLSTPAQGFRPPRPSAGGSAPPGPRGHLFHPIATPPPPLARSNYAGAAPRSPDLLPTALPRGRARLHICSIVNGLARSER